MKKTQKALCFIDARTFPQRCFFKKNSTKSMLKDKFEDVEFLFLIRTSEDLVYFDQPNEVIIATEISSFAQVLKEIQKRASKCQVVFLSEIDCSPSESWLNELPTSINSKCIYLPDTILIQMVGDRIGCFVQSQKNMQSSWVKSVFFCFAISSQALNFSVEPFGKIPLGSLRESFAQLFSSRKLKFQFIPNSLAFTFDHGISYLEVLRNQQSHCGFYDSHRPIPAEQKEKSALQAVTKAKKSNSQGEAFRDADLTSQIRLYSKIDIRWSTLPMKEFFFVPLSIPFYLHEEVYAEACQRLKGSDLIIVLHQLRRGGTERVAFLHLQAYCQLFPNCKIGLITTLPVEPDWDWQLPKQVTVFELGSIIAPRFQDHYAQDYLLFRIVNQISPRFLHVNGSALGWHMVDAFGVQIARSTKIIMSLFCVEFLKNGSAISFSFHELLRAAPFISCILTDNSYFLNQVSEIVKIPYAKNVHYPAFSKQQSWSAPKEKAKLQILWGSRLSFQKDVATLCKIAVLFHNIDFHVFGEPSETWDYYQDFQSIKNIKAWGMFDGVDELNLSDYDAFLYTSNWDGLPNILLEIGSAGMPVISPMIGGIPEILNEANSYPYHNLRQLFGILEKWNQTEAIKKGKLLQKEIKITHSWDRFIDLCRDVYV